MYALWGRKRLRPSDSVQEYIYVMGSETLSPDQEYRYSLGSEALPSTCYILFDYLVNIIDTLLLYD